MTVCINQNVDGVCMKWAGHMSVPITIANSING